MVHDLNPFIWEFWSGFGIRWYGMAYLMGFVAGYFFILKMASNHRSPMPVRLVADFVTFVAIGTMLGGRLGYVLFYSPDLILKFDSKLPYWGVLAVNEGGMASHGGMIGIAIACFLFARKHGLNLLHLFDLVAATGPIGIFFGRIANFINGELVGRPCDPNYALGVKFPSDIYLWPSSDPGKLRELASVVEPLGMNAQKWNDTVDAYLNGGTQASATTTYAEARSTINSVLIQIVDSIQHGNVAVKNALAPLLVLRHPSQLYGALGEGLLLFIILGLVWYKPRKPGVIAALFIVLYAMVRITDEQFRMPDAHIGFQWLDLTRGQWLSVGMLTVGIFLLIFWGRRHTIAISGWGRP